MASPRDWLLGLSVAKKGLILVIAGSVLFAIDYLEPPAHRQVIMQHIPLWGFGLFGAALGVIVVIVGLVRRR